MKIIVIIIMLSCQQQRLHVRTQNNIIATAVDDLVSTWQLDFYNIYVRVNYFPL